MVRFSIRVPYSGGVDECKRRDFTPSIRLFAFHSGSSLLAFLQIFSEALTLGSSDTIISVI